MCVCVWWWGVWGVSGGVQSYKNLGKRVSTGAADIAHGWVERHSMDGLLKLLTVSCDLLDARLGFHVPQTHRGVVT